jgi:hypothetical protein
MYNCTSREVTENVFVVVIICSNQNKTHTQQKQQKQERKEFSTIINSIDPRVKNHRVTSKDISSLLSFDLFCFLMMMMRDGGKNLKNSRHQKLIGT